MGFTDIFGGNTIYPADPTYLALALTANVVLEWPVETATTALVAAAIIDATPNAPGRTITLSDARQTSNGYVSTFYNAGADTYTVKDAAGGTILTVASGQAWNLYLRDNSTLAGAWRIFQMGAGVSTANAAALAGAGLEADGTVLNEEMTISNHAVNYALVDGDRALVVTWTGGTGQFTLPDASTVGANWFAWIKNNGGGSLTVAPATGTIDGSASVIMATLESTAVVSDGVNWFTVGFGQENASVFDFISINVAGSGDFVLSGAQLNRVAYQFTGLLTGNRNIIVPASIQQYWVTNSTTGAFNLTVKTAAGTGVIVPPGARAILYCDGTNVVNADDASSISFPILVNQGGTGATTAANARTNLGATTVGGNLFTAASAAAALALIATAGNGILITGTSIATDTGGLAPGYLDIPVNVQNTNYVLALADRGKNVASATAGGYSRTIPPHSSVAFPTGATIMISNGSTSTFTIVRGVGVSLLFADGTNADRSLGQYGMATITQISQDLWIVAGAGVS